jgi:hypothetical protein
MHEPYGQVPGEDDVGVDVAGCAGFFGGEVDPEASGVVEDVEEGSLGWEEGAPGG